MTTTNEHEYTQWLAPSWREAAAPGATRQARVLFVDDDERALEALGRLMPRGEDRWDARFATSVDEALAQLGEEPCDIIVADVQMPGRDGFDLLRAVLSDPRLARIPVVMVTGADDADLKRRALAGGAIDLLGKPYVREDLLARIASAFRFKVQQDEIIEQRHALAAAVMELLNSRQHVFWTLARATTYRDNVTGSHIARVSTNSVVIAKALGLSDEFVASIALASPLHDVGKIGIPDRILNKPGALTPIEWDVMKEHCRIGAAILSPDSMSPELLNHWNSVLPTDHLWLGRLAETTLNGDAGVGSLWDGTRHTLDERNTVLEMASRIAMSHHERWDGSGYPRGLAGADIPLEARILAISDVYDALRSRRPYKPAFSEEETLATIRGAVGRHFDPEVVAAFERCRNELAEIFESIPNDDVSTVIGAA